MDAYHLDATPYRLSRVKRRLSSFTGTIITGVQEELFKKGHNLAVLPTNDNMAKEMDYLQMIIESGAAGVPLHPTKSEYYNPYVTQLLEQGIPLVMTGRYYRFVDCSYVDSHNYQGAYDGYRLARGFGFIEPDGWQGGKTDEGASAYAVG